MNTKGFGVRYDVWEFRAFSTLGELSGIPRCVKPCFSLVARYHAVNLKNFCRDARRILRHSNLANSLKRIREERGLSQVELAEKAQCSNRTISNYETGAVARISDELLKKLADVLGVSTDEIEAEPAAVLREEPRPYRSPEQSTKAIDLLLKVYELEAKARGIEFDPESFLGRLMGVMSEGGEFDLAHQAAIKLAQLFKEKGRK